MRRKTAIIGGVTALIVIQLLILAGYAVILLRTELATGASSSERLTPFLEFGRTVDKYASAFYKGPVPEQTLPAYRLEIDPDQWGRMMQSLPAADAAFDEELAPWAPATFAAEDAVWEAHVRVHGESPAHFIWPKKSFDVQFAKDKPFHSSQAISFLIPEERGWVNDPLLQERSRALGLLHPEVSFVDLHINGRGPMVYLASEEWSVDLAREQGRGGSLSLYAPSVSAEDAGGAIDAAYWERIGDGDERAPDDALGLLSELSRPGAETDPDYLANLSQVMDIDRLAAYMALRMLMGNPEAEPDEMRLLYRSDRGLFEPVPWKITLSQPRVILAPSGIALLDNASRVPSLRSRAQAMLQEYLKDHAETDIAFFKTARGNIEAALFTDQWKLPSNRIVRNALEAQQKLVEGTLTDLQAQLSTAEVLMNQRVPQDGGEVLLVIDANARGPVAGMLTSITFPLRYSEILARGEITLVRDTGDGAYGEGDLPMNALFTGSTMRFSEGQERLLWPGNPAVTSQGELLRLPHRRHRFYLVGGITTPALSLDALPLPVGIGNAVTGKEGQVIGTALIDDRVYGETLPPQMKREEFLSRYKQFAAQGENGLLLKGSVVLEGLIAIPPEMPLTVAPGTQIRMEGGATVLSFSSVSMLGEENAAIRILPADTEEQWGTFAIIDASEPSDLHYVTVEGGKGASAGGKFFKGSITFAGSPGSITNVTITGAQGESALALSQMFVDVRDSTITGSAHGGIIIESALAGRMESVTVLTSSGHAIDVLGSPIVLRNIIVDGGSQACIHVAARATPLMEDSRLRGCRIGIFAEDGGHVVAKNLRLVSNDIGFFAGGGSAAFGPGSIIANDTVSIYHREEIHEQSGGVVAVE